MTAPLEGYRVLDITSIVLGPYAGQWLGDWGADVIKIEAPPNGDTFRAVGKARHPGMGGPYLNCNRNKRGIALDLKHPDGKTALRRLIETADVFLHNMRPRAIARLGFDYDAVAAIRPDIVYCGAYGFSQAGPYRDRPAYDDIIQSMSGIASLMQRTVGRPAFAPTVLVDKLVGQTAAHAVTMALLHRERTGEGQFVEVPMFETAVAFMMVEHLYDAAFRPPLGDPGYVRLTTPYRKPNRAKDGYICVLPYTDRQWQQFFAFVGRAELADDPRFCDHAARNANIDALYRLLDELMPARTIAEWTAFCEGAGIPAAPVLDLDQVLADPHLAEVGLFERHRHPSEGEITLTRPPITMSKSPGAIRRQAPALGADGAAILAELGYDADEIARLSQAGVLWGASAADDAA